MTSGEQAFRDQMGTVNSIGWIIVTGLLLILGVILFLHYRPKKKSDLDYFE
jgi:hypothetical protein